MPRRLSATPCPVTHQQDVSLINDYDETNTTFDFTSAIRPSLYNARPRRQQGPAQFAIHEDSSNTDNPSVHDQPALSKPAKRTVPTRAIPRSSNTRSSKLGGSASDLTATIHPLRTSRLAQAPKRPVVRESISNENVVSEQESVNRDNNTITAVARPARRGTIYIPNEDTTMPSMYMGIFSPIKNFEPLADTSQNNAAPMEITGIAAQMIVKRGIRKSTMGVAPRRVPLQRSSRALQETNTVVDRPGQGGGKENLPPNWEQCERKMLDLKLDSIGECSNTGDSPPKHTNCEELRNCSRSTAYAPTAASSHRANSRESPKNSPRDHSLTDGQRKQIWNGNNWARSVQHVSIRPRRAQQVSNPIAKTTSPKLNVPSRFVVPEVRADLVIENHALLSENIANPLLYEDDWLNHQEISLTQLINSLFKASRKGQSTLHQGHSLRRQLLDVYNVDSMVLTYKRLQAALLYGSLGIPEDVLSQGDSLHKDIGRKQKFVDLWLCSYNPTYLQSALEVVIGRECRPSKPRTSTGASSPRLAVRRTLQTYIEAFLIRNEDGRPDPEAKSRCAWSYHRTILRSLMLVKVLDVIKTDHSIDSRNCLFIPTSTFKSSTLIVRSIIQMLNPAAGDPIRALSYIGYEIGHSQHSLEEFNYQIDNLAVDLRDGTRLTRLVELLLYPSASQDLGKVQDNDATTILMPEGEKFDFKDGQDWPLSQHLKFPCQSRIARQWNVQVALSAIKNVQGMHGLVDGISADDIVDGYREKTIRLLWALVGKWGLTGLIDWKDMNWEIRRLRLRLTNTTEYDDDEAGISEDLSSFESCKLLLKTWARTVTEYHNVKVSNFTTSFSDGKAFEAIVNEYTPYLTQIPPVQPTTSLPQRLTAVGCSQQFANLFSNNVSTHVFDRDFVLAALAFLCSRLLAPSRRARAAAVIQGAWRKYWVRVEERRKVERKRVAVACAEIVNTKAENRCSDDGGSVDPVNQEDLGIVPDVDLVNRSIGSPTRNDEDIWLSL